MNAPINLFFDVTPIGKILNRFSRDLDMIDDEITFTISWCSQVVWGAMISLFVIVYAIPYILVIEALYVYLMIRLFNMMHPARKECFRIMSCQFSPILSFF